jgi:hypothetical protein
MPSCCTFNNTHTHRKESEEKGEVDCKSKSIVLLVRFTEDEQDEEGEDEYCRDSDLVVRIQVQKASDSSH